MIVIRNTSKKKFLSIKIKSFGFCDKFFGMLIKDNKNGLILKTRFGIHTFFMKEPIDVLVLDGNKRVVAIKKNLLPNRIFLWNPKYDTILELPKDSINQSETEVGDALNF